MQVAFRLVVPMILSLVLISASSCQDDASKIQVNKLKSSENKQGGASGELPVPGDDHDPTEPPMEDSKLNWDGAMRDDHPAWMVIAID